MLREFTWAVLCGFVLLVPTPAWCEAPVAEQPAAKKPAAEAKPAKQDEKAKRQFIRVARDEKGRPTAMETPIIRYEPADGTRAGLVVDLIGAVHVGDKAYYEALNKAFEKYDVVLYELVAPEGTRIPRNAKAGGGHPVAAIQGGMKSMLELEHQLEHVDYTRENLVHADMSPDEFAKSMEERGEGFLQMFFKAMGHSMAMQGKGKVNDFTILSALFAKDRAYRLKLLLAEQFEDLEAQMGIFDGPKGSTIITERNRKAFEVLTREIDGGKKKIGVFYGAGHLPDMEKRLLNEFKLERRDESWITAWDLAQPAKKN